MPTNASAWWRDAVGYEVYLRSFADGNDDGIGDLRGVTDRLDHLAWLGVEIVWITPFYPSPMVDFGYDVAGYTDVHPTFGTLDDFDALIAKADRLGLRVVIDIVPNHTSDQHPWFQAARASATDPKRDYYHWRDIDPDGELPNNWVGYFGGPVWTTDEVAGQQFLHMFLPQQPDLNWSNPAVVDEFDHILRFWLDRGVSGFRIDVAQAMVKDAELRSNPELRPVDHAAPRWEQWDSLDHRHDILQPETHDIFRRWRRIVEDYDAVLIGETYVLEPEQLAPLLDGTGLHVGFWFKPMHIDWTAKEIHSALRDPIDAGASDIGWVLASHDEPRPPTRFGGGEIGARRSLAFSTMLLGLPGLPFLYQGEELLLENGLVPADRKADPVGGDDVDAGRDGCRTPMPWAAGAGAGFTTGEPWLPISHDRPEQTVAGQRDDPGSPIHRVRSLIALRRRIGAEPGLVWTSGAGDTRISYRRGRYEFVLNAGDEPIAAGDASARAVFSSAGGEIDVDAGALTIEIDEAAVICHEQ